MPIARPPPDFACPGFFDVNTAVLLELALLALLLPFFFFLPTPPVFLALEPPLKLPDVERFRDELALPVAVWDLEEPLDGGGCICATESRQ